METIFSCVPITALNAFHLGGKTLLLAGQGQVLSIYDCKSGRELVRSRIFKSDSIHGISAKPAASGPIGASSAYVLLWAGNNVAVVSLSCTVINAQVESIDVRLSSSLQFTASISDWVLFGEFFTSDESDCIKAFVVTTHNELHEVVLDLSPNRDIKPLRHGRLLSGPGCVLYSAHARQTSNELLVAAGTVFGETVLWSASRNKVSGTWSAKVLKIFLSHRGSVFGICISDQLTRRGHPSKILATCSDDRTIRLWNIEDTVASSDFCIVEEFDLPQLSDVTGFGEAANNQDSLLAMTWAHLSRIWTVQILPTTFNPSDTDLWFISTGEDASFHLWRIDLNAAIQEPGSSGLKLQKIKSRTNHSGKNIWSSHFDCYGGECDFYTGGADGSIVVSSLLLRNGTKVPSSDCRFEMVFCQIFNEVDRWEKRQIHSSPASVKQYAFAGTGLVVASADTGDVLVGQLKDSSDKYAWTNVFDSENQKSTLFCGDRGTDLVFFTGVSRNLAAISRNSEKVLSSSILVDSDTSYICTAACRDSDASGALRATILVASSHRGSAALLNVAIEERINVEHSASLRLPPKFIPTCACYNSQKHMIIIGSRSGSIAIYDNLIDSCSTGVVFEALHGSDTVTSLQFIYADSAQSRPLPPKDLFVLSTGRDGSYAIHKISPPSSEYALLIQETIHRSSPSIGPNIEGAYLTTSATTGKIELLLYGFKSSDFVVWNETKQTVVLSVDCGGAHRSWAYHPLRDNDLRTVSHGGEFVWTKAGAFNYYRKNIEDTHIIREGGHGREIKALAISSLLEKAILIATGAEDTTIRLFIAKANGFEKKDNIEDRTMSMIGILNKHTTGICHLQFSACGSFLLSSGGCEELFMWKINKDIPVIGIGTVLECKLPKTAIDADARITSFVLRETEKFSATESESSGGIFNIAAAYSNGKYKVFEYVSASKTRNATFKLLSEVVEGSFCLTQIWQQIPSGGAAGRTIVTAGTNGYINIHSGSTDGLCLRHRIHQSSVQSCLVSKLQGNAIRYLVVTGGDDNGLGVTIINFSTAKLDGQSKAFESLLIPKAHAAAVTGVTLLSQRSTSEGCEARMIASVSNDQTVKVWRITFATHHTGPFDHSIQHLQIEMLAEYLTSVADAAAIETLPGDHLNSSQNHGHEVLIIGVGMEILKIPNFELDPELSSI